MVSIDNKTNSASNLVGIKQNVSPDEVDMLFAELFALVHSGSNEEYAENDSNIYNIDQVKVVKTLYTPKITIKNRRSCKVFSANFL